MVAEAGGGPEGGTGVTRRANSGAAGATDVSFVMPCLNEAVSLPACIGMAKEAAERLRRDFGLSSEIVIADNGSTDGSQALASSLGARVVPVAEKGYGAALRGGFVAAHGRYLVMGDADGSYDFREAVGMVAELVKGADLCMGSRFKGGVRPGAMPWKNRYIGNPILTGILNVLFGTRIDDAHCGLRALTRACFERLKLTGAGMEFASEMVIKAALKGEQIVEVAATLSPDLRDRAPHLRPWRDGWRHLRYLFMLSPAWLFVVPAAISVLIGAGILGGAGWHALFGDGGPFFFGNYWSILAAAMIGAGHIAGLLGVATHLYGVHEGYRTPKRWMPAIASWVTLETMLAGGAAAVAAGFLVLLAVAFAWFQRDLGATQSVLPAVVGVLLVTLGVQNVMGGFLLAILGGNEARFLASPTPARKPTAELSASIG
jgi:glycosyltransferase involved in cell wall biosynthesis